MIWIIRLFQGSAETSFAESQKNGLIINSTDDLPKSFVVVKEKDETKVFISSVSSKVLAKRGL